MAINYLIQNKEEIVNKYWIWEWMVYVYQTSVYPRTFNYLNFSGSDSYVAIIIYIDNK